MPLANTEVVEMMRIAQLWQICTVNVGMALGYGRVALVITEKPHCSAAGKHRASPSDRSPSTLGQEALAIAQLGSLVLGRAIAAMERVALCPRHRQARNRHSLASEGISIVFWT